MQKAARVIVREVQLLQFLLHYYQHYLVPPGLQPSKDDLELWSVADSEALDEFPSGVVGITNSSNCRVDKSSQLVVQQDSANLLAELLESRSLGSHSKPEDFELGCDDEQHKFAHETLGKKGRSLKKPYSNCPQVIREKSEDQVVEHRAGQSLLEFWELQALFSYLRGGDRPKDFLSRS